MAAPKRAKKVASPKIVRKPSMRVRIPSRLKSALAGFRDLREEYKSIGETLPVEQQRLVLVMREVDPDNHGIIYDPTDENKGAAYVQQNAAQEFWNLEELVAYLRKDKGTWMACSSRVFDAQKFEAEMKSGNIPASEVAKFRVKGEPPAPFIRFGKPGKDSR